MAWTSVLESVSTVAAALGAIFAAVALRLNARGSRIDLEDRRARARAEIDGVAVSWRTETSGTAPPTTDEKLAEWTEQITVIVEISNPGSLPIDRVEASVHFPAQVRRRREDGTVLAPTVELEHKTAVIAHGATRRWHRTDLVTPDALAVLDTEPWHAVVTFHDADGVGHRNVWPR